MIPIRDSTRSRSFPLVNYVLIVTNILVFLLELSLGDEVDNFIFQWAMVPALLTTDPVGVQSPGPPPVLTLFTSMFLHGGWAHLLGNMLFLWVFGDNVEDSMGKLRYLAFYLLAGLAAAVAQLFVSLDSQVPSLGASGAISGILGAYLVLFPRAQVLTWIPPLIIVVIRLPAILFIGLWFVFQAFQGITTAGDPISGGGVAWWAHIGGFVAGLILVNVFRRRERYKFISY